ncbi:DUF874 family protein, partial [Staphylococcus pseudintermedius]
MKFHKTIGVAVATTFLLAACSKDGEHIEKYNDGLENMQKAEAPIQEVNKEMNKLEKEKEKLSKEISGKNIAEVQDKVDQVLDNAKKREKQLKKEVEAMNHSK